MKTFRFLFVYDMAIVILKRNVTLERLCSCVHLLIYRDSRCWKPCECHAHFSMCLVNETVHLTIHFHRHMQDLYLNGIFQVDVMGTHLNLDKFHDILRYTVSSDFVNGFRNYVCVSSCNLINKTLFSISVFSETEWNFRFQSFGKKFIFVNSFHLNYVFTF